MHTYNGIQTYIHYNSDMSGDVVLVDKHTGDKIEIPGADLLDFIANYVRNTHISRLEQAETSELLGISPWAQQGLPKGHPAK